MNPSGICCRLDVLRFGLNLEPILNHSVRIWGDIGGDLRCLRAGSRSMAFALRMWSIGYVNGERRH